MRESGIETDPEEISASWINEHLIDSDDNTRVDNVTATPIGTGQLARTVRFCLAFAQENTSFPHSFVGKFPSENATSLETATAGGLYRNEVGFYRDLQPRLSIRTPACYHAEIDTSGSAFTLLLEDLRSASPGDQIAGCDPNIAQAAVLELAGLHAPTWNKPELRQLNWMRPVGAPAQTDQNLLLFQQNLPGFLSRFKETLNAEIIGIFEQVAAQSSYSKLFSRYSEACLVHGDYRLDNLLIDTSTTPASIYTVDWQTIAPGNPMLDVALFVGGGLLPEARSLHEETIVREYHERLISLGVTDYDWRRCWNHYRLATFTGFMTAVNAAMMTVRTARGDELFNTMAHRHAQHALDLGAQTLLS
jgi:hypothetical protein